MNSQKSHKNFGLQPLDKRWRKRGKDYSHSKTFGSVSLADLPDENLLVSTILDQNGYPRCTAESGAAEKESQYGVYFDDVSAQDFFAEEGVTAGRVNPNGYDLETKMKTFVRYGMVPKNGTKADAATYKDPAYFSIHNDVLDLFDSLRSSMWKERVKRRCPTVGLMWYDSWEKVPNGIIPDSPPQNPIGLHDVKYAGWCSKTYITKTPFPNGELRACIQNSFGPNVGEGGLFYFSRAQVNKYFTEGQYIPSDVPEGLDIKKVSDILDLISRAISLMIKLAGMLGFPDTKKNVTITPMVPIDETIPPPAPSMNPTKIQRWAAAIATQEGAKPELHNPGNLKFSTLTASWGCTKGFQATDGGWIGKFDTYQKGFDALCNFLTLGCEDQLIAFHHARTLRLFTKVYACPPSDAYAENVAKALGVSPDIDIKELL